MGLNSFGTQRLFAFVPLLIVLCGCQPELVLPTEPAATAVSTATSIPSATLSDELATPIALDCTDGTLMFVSDLIPDGRIKEGDEYYYSSCSDGARLVEGVANGQLWQPEISPLGDRMVKIEQGGHFLIVEDLQSHEPTIILDKIPEEVQYFAWSTDAQYIAYSLIEKQPSGLRHWYWRMEIVHVDTQTISPQVIPDQLPGILMGEVPPQDFDVLSWSPDGEFILLAGPNRPFHIFEIDCSTTHICMAEFRSMSTKSVTGASYSFAWSSNAERIAYAYTTAYETRTDDPAHPDIDFEHGLCIENVDGELVQEYKSIDMGVEDIRSLSWSPDGSRIAFTARETGQSDLDVFVLSLTEDEGIYNLTDGLSGDQQDPIWIP